MKHITFLMTWLILKALNQGMSDCQGNDGAMTSHRIFQSRFSKSSLDVVRGF